MKYTLLSFLLVSSMAFAQTVILFEDGSTLTLDEDESVYVSDRGVFKAHGTLYRGVKFTRMEPTEDRDYVAPPPSEPVPCDGQLTFGGGCIEVPEEVEEEDEDGGDFTFGG